MSRRRSAKKGYPMTKKEIIETLAEKLKKPKTEIKKVLEGCFDLMIKELGKGKSVQIVGLGNFKVKKRASRVGRNPRTGEKLVLPATKTPHFTAGKALKDAVKKKR